MKILLVDDEHIAREGLKRILGRVFPDSKIIACSRSDEALDEVQSEYYPIIFLDIMMEPFDGVETAKAIRKIYGDKGVNIIFTTGYSEFTGEAMKLHASGYLIKPITEEKVRSELEDLRYPLEEKEEDNRLVAQTFGNFEVFMEGNALSFAYTKSKELLAYLIDRRGAQCSNQELMAVLGQETKEETLSYSYYNLIRRSLVETLESAGLEGLILRTRGGIRVDTSMIKCDYLELLEGSEDARRNYQGEYMSQYSWAEETNGEIYRICRE